MKSGRKFLLTNLLYLKVFIAFVLGIVAVEISTNYWLLVGLPFILYGLLTLTYFIIKVSRSKYLDSLIFCSIFALGILFHSWTLYDKSKSTEKLSPILEIETSHLVRIEDKTLLKANSLQL